MPQKQYYALPKQIKETIIPNRWDIIALVFLVGIISLLGATAENMTVPYEVGKALPISLSPTMLPEYGMRTVLRIFLALIFSLLFSVTFGALAARSKRAERIIIPLIDICQSVPVLGFLSITVVGFIALFPNSLLGPECAAIFAIFTAQAWNMTLSIYQSFRTVPSDLIEVSRLLKLSTWQHFWRIQFPFAVPSLLWNMMMSVSGSWFFVVASEAITVSNQNILLPGIGSYISVAIHQADLRAVIYAASTMFIIILIYDQLFFRPLIKWSEKFSSSEIEEEDGYSSWVYTLLKRTRLLRFLSDRINIVSNGLVTTHMPLLRPSFLPKISHSFHFTLLLGKGLDVAFFLLLGATLYGVSNFILSHLHLKEVVDVFFLGAITALRVSILIILASLLWIPVGVWVGLRPRVAGWVQPIAQFLAAFPANLLFPFVVLVIVRYSLNVQVWTTPLMILGTQWYILFNVIAGTSALPKELRYAAQNFGVKGWLWWKRVGLPAIFPYFITGALAAAGGCWNASIVAEVVSWGDTTLVATGLGAYISKWTTVGDFPRIILGITVMCIYVTFFNRFFWHRLYLYAEARCRVDI